MTFLEYELWERSNVIQLLVILISINLFCFSVYSF